MRQLEGVKPNLSEEVLGTNKKLKAFCLLYTLFYKIRPSSLNLCPFYIKFYTSIFYQTRNLSNNKNLFETACFLKSYFQYFMVTNYTKKHQYIALNNTNHAWCFGILQNEHSFSKNRNKKCMD